MKQEEYRICEASSVNLRIGRTGKRKENRLLDEPVKYVCSLCGKQKALGKDSFVFARLIYMLGNKRKDVSLCEKCVDVFSDIIRFGPRVIREAHKWQRHSRVVKVAQVQGRLFCFKCLGTQDSHVFIQYDDLDVPGMKGQFRTRRICARCAISFLSMMFGNEEIASAPFRQKRFLEEEVWV